MATVTIRLIINGVTYDVSGSLRLYDSFNRACNEEFHHATSEINCTFSYTPELLSLLAQDQILVEADVDGTRSFTGRLSPASIKTKSFGAGLSQPNIEDITVTFEDNTYQLQRQIKNEDNLIIENALVCDPVQPTKSCVHRLLALAGLNPVALPSIAVTLLAFAPDPGTTILDVLDKLLYEYGYSFTFDNYGAIKLVQVIHDTIVPDATLTEEILRTPFEFEKLQKEADTIEVVYYPLKTKSRVLLYMADLPFGDDGLRSGWPIQPGYLWPEEANVQEAWFEYTDKAIGSLNDNYGKVIENKDFTSIILTKNHIIDQKIDEGITRPVTIFENKRARLVYHNIDPVSRNIYYCDIIGDCIYRAAKNTITKDITVTPYQKDSYEAQYIHDEANAVRLCAFRAERQKSSCWRYQFKTDEPLSPGSVIRLIDPYSGIDALALIIEKDWNAETDEYSYKAIGLVSPILSGTLAVSTLLPEPKESNIPSAADAILTSSIRISCSAPVVFMHSDGSYTPEMVTFTAAYKDGTPYLGRWRIYRGGALEYESTADEPFAVATSDIILTDEGFLPSDDLTLGSSAFRAVLYAAGGTTSKLYEYIISTISDANGISQAYADAAAELARITAEAYADAQVSQAEAAAIGAAQAAVDAALAESTDLVIAAHDAAQAYAAAQAHLAEITAVAYADGVVSAEEARAIADAQAKLEEAKQYADAAAANAVEDANAAVPTYTPKYIGTTTDNPPSVLTFAAKVPGDWCLSTTAKQFYLWTGSAWTTTGITTAHRMAALQDMLSIADASDTTSFVQTLVAVDAFINKLFSKYIKLQTGGSIRGGDRYDASGNLVDGNVQGFWLGADGILKARDAYLDGGLYAYGVPFMVVAAFNFTDNAGTAVLLSGKNISSLSRFQQGGYRINFTTPIKVRYYIGSDGYRYIDMYVIGNSHSTFESGFDDVTILTINWVRNYIDGRLSFDSEFAYVTYADIYVCDNNYDQLLAPKVAQGVIAISETRR